MTLNHKSGLTYCDPCHKGLSSPNLLSSLNRSKGAKEVCQVDHQVSNGVDGVQVVLFVCSADVLKSGEGGPQLGDEGGHSGDGAGRLLQLGATLGTEDQLGGVGQLVHEDSKTSEGAEGLVRTGLADDGSVRGNVVNQGPEDPHDLCRLPDNLRGL